MAARLTLVSFREPNPNRMASAVVSLQVGAAPTLVPAGDVEVLETFAQIPDGNEPVTVRLRAKPGSKQAELLQRQSEGSKLLVSGKLHLEDSEPVITPQVICEATDDQYFNEVTLVGNLARQGREAGKSCSQVHGHLQTRSQRRRLG